MTHEPPPVIPSCSVHAAAGKGLPLSAGCAAAGAYRARRPQPTPLYRLVEAHYEEVKGQWKERLLVAFGAGDSPARLRRACDPLGHGHEPLPSGRFSADSSVTVEPEDGTGLERLARYLLRPPVSLERMRWDRGADEVAYSRKAEKGHRGAVELFDPLDFLARVIAHVPEPRLHMVRYLGHYSNS